MEEVWKDIKGYEGLYQVSNHGRVKSLERKVKWINGKYRAINEKIRIANLNAYGYKQLKLSKNGNNKMFRVHRLVAMTFIPNPDNLPHINHKDEIKTNNNVENLEWCTHEYNMNYGTKVERQKQTFKNSPLRFNDPTKSTPVAAFKHDILIYAYPSIMEAVRNGFNATCICECCRGKQKTHNGYTWKYYYER